LSNSTNAEKSTLDSKGRRGERYLPSKTLKGKNSKIPFRTLQPRCPPFVNICKRSMPKNSLKSKNWKDECQKWFEKKKKTPKKLPGGTAPVMPRTSILRKNNGKQRKTERGVRRKKRKPAQSQAPIPSNTSPSQTPQRGSSGSECVTIERRGGRFQSVSVKRTPRSTIRQVGAKKKNR